VCSKLDLRFAPPEAGGLDPLAIITGGGRPLALREAVSALHRAAEDSRVTGLIAHVQLPAAAAGPIQELREAVAAFTAVKTVAGVGRDLSGNAVLLPWSSAFGDVWMQPSERLG